ncbi:uncharacterized protein LOC119147491 isoform X5 [Falco rusticolus]|uniref:uncharacterized protein LOC119147491 isoform X5 n=1 Tax=Falco rusticolus TaxID=120794 RepID=UPI00188696DA|nr:uncharacterized protein LOC119147491 isoform X5 [Falco rusticolus]
MQPGPAMRSQWGCEVTELRGDAPAINSDASAPSRNCSRRSSGGDSGTGSIMSLQGAMTLARHLNIILLLLVTLHARAAWAAPWQEQEVGEDAAKVYRDAWQAVGLEPLGHPAAVAVGKGAADSQRGSRTEPLGDRTMGVPVGRTRPAPRQWDAARGWHRRGSAIEKYRAEGENESSELVEQLRHVLEEWKRGHVPSKPGEDHHSKINRAYEPGSDDVIERTTELYNPPSPPTVSSPRDPGKLYTIGAVAAVLSLQVAIVLGCVVVWWRRKKKAPVAGASADQLENGSCPSRPDSWTLQEPLPSGRAENQASPRPPCHLSPSPASLQQSRQSSAVQPMTAPRQQRKQPRTLQHPTKTQRPRRPPSPHPVALERRRQSSSLESQDQPQSPSHPPSRLPSTLQQQD